MRGLRRLAPFVPVLLLIGLAAVGIANALQDDEEPDFGPQPGDYPTADGGSDIAGYLVAAGKFREAPAIPFDEELEFRVFGCTEGEPITIEIVPRFLRPEEEEAQEDLEDDEKLLTEPEVVVEEDEALAEPGTYDVTIPLTIPRGFVRLRVTCTGADGAEAVWDTVLDVWDAEEFEAAQEELDEDEREELVTTIDGGDVPESIVVAPAAESGE